MRLGIFGGTFDPVHYGHLLLAESCREQLRLDQVWFLPAAVPPHKQERDAGARPSQRVEMLELAIGGHAGVSPSAATKSTAAASTTRSTRCRAFKAEDPARELFFLMGADSLRDLPSWRESGQICELATPVMVVPRRPGPRPSQATNRSIGAGWRRSSRPSGLRDIRNHQVQMPRIDLSTSDIRAAGRRGRRAFAIARRAPSKNTSNRTGCMPRSADLSQASRAAARADSQLRRLCAMAAVIAAGEGTLGGRWLRKLPQRFRAPDRAVRAELRARSIKEPAAALEFAGARGRAAKPVLADDKAALFGQRDGLFQ